MQSANVSQEVGAHGEYVFMQQMAMESPKLWSVTEPSLYRLRSTVRVSGQVVDEYQTPFGIREAVSMRTAAFF